MPRPAKGEAARTSEKALDALRELFDRGLSDREIADELNRRGLRLCVSTLAARRKALVLGGGIALRGCLLRLAAEIDDHHRRFAGRIRGWQRRVRRLYERWLVSQEVVSIIASMLPARRRRTSRRRLKEGSYRGGPCSSGVPQMLMTWMTPCSSSTQ